MTESSKIIYKNKQPFKKISALYINWQAFKNVCGFFCYEFKIIRYIKISYDIF